MLIYERAVKTLGEKHKNDNFINVRQLDPHIMYNAYKWTVLYSGLTLTEWMLMNGKRWMFLYVFLFSDFLMGLDLIRRPNSSDKLVMMVSKEQHKLYFVDVVHKKRQFADDCNLTIYNMHNDVVYY